MPQLSENGVALLMTQEETIRVSTMKADMDVDCVENTDPGCKMIAIPYKVSKLTR